MSKLWKSWVSQLLCSCKQDLYRGQTHVQNCILSSESSLCREYFVECIPTDILIPPPPIFFPAKEEKPALGFANEGMSFWYWGAPLLPLEWSDLNFIWAWCASLVCLNCCYFLLIRISLKNFFWESVLSETLLGLGEGAEFFITSLGQLWTLLTTTQNSTCYVDCVESEKVRISCLPLHQTQIKPHPEITLEVAAGTGDHDF